MLQVYQTFGSLKEGAECVADYRPVSLIYAFAKLIDKIVALCLSPYMNQLISSSQSAFIRGHSIHDNFLYVRNMMHRFHKNKTPALFIKVDISKAFDLVRWDYLLALMKHRGFPLRWLNWIVATLTPSTSRVLLINIPLASIQHGRGLTRGTLYCPLFSS